MTLSFNQAMSLDDIFSGYSFASVAEKEDEEEERRLRILQSDDAG